VRARWGRELAQHGDCEPGRRSKAPEHFAHEFVQKNSSVMEESLQDCDKRRVLCLHGWRTNTDVMRFQVPVALAELLRVWSCAARKCHV